MKKMNKTKQHRPVFALLGILGLSFIASVSSPSHMARQSDVGLPPSTAICVDLQMNSTSKEEKMVVSESGNVYTLSTPADTGKESFVVPFGQQMLVGESSEEKIDPGYGTGNGGVHESRSAEELGTNRDAGTSEEGNKDIIMSLAIIAAVLSILSITAIVYFYLKKKNGK